MIWRSGGITSGVTGSLLSKGATVATVAKGGHDGRGAGTTPRVAEATPDGVWGHPLRIYWTGLWGQTMAPDHEGQGEQARQVAGGRS